MMCVFKLKILSIFVYSIIVILYMSHINRINSHNFSQTSNKREILSIAKPLASS